MKVSSSICYYYITDTPRIRVPAKVWKVKKKIPCGLYLKGKIPKVKASKWVISQVLN